MTRRRTAYGVWRTAYGKLRAPLRVRARASPPGLAAVWSRRGGCPLRFPVLKAFRAGVGETERNARTTARLHVAGPALCDDASARSEYSATVAIAPGEVGGANYTAVIRTGEERVALAVNQQTDLTALVVHAVADNYPAGSTRITDHATPDGPVPVLIIDAVQRAEVVVPAAVALTTMGPSLAEADLPRDVWVLVEASRMGAAHRALRGAGVTLQPWWEDGHIHFGRPERS